MAGFVFKLEPLLKARKHRERELQLAVAGIERQRLELERRLRNHQQCIVRGKQDLRQRLVGTLDLRSLRLQASSALHAARLAQQVAITLAGVHQRLGEARAQLQEAARQRRAIELLRDRRYARWKARQDRLESAALDDLVTNAAARKETVS